MARLTSDWLVERLKAWGVTRFYGYPVTESDAKMDHVPVLAIVGQAEVTVRGSSYQQELNLDRMFSGVANFVQEVDSPAQLRPVVDRDIRIALAQRGVAVVILPKDVQDEPWEEPTKAHGFTRSGPGYTKPRIVPTAADLERAAEVLNEGRKVAILIGAWARGAAAEVLDVADILGAGIAKAPRGKDVLPDDLPFVIGAIGLFGTQPSYELMSDCDTLLMIGTGFPWPEFLPPDGQARAVQIDIVQKYWPRWVDPRLIVCVLNNEDLNEVTWEQRASEGNPRYMSSQALPNVSYA